MPVLRLPVRRTEFVMGVVLIPLLVWFSAIFVAQSIGKSKGKNNSWLWGLFLSWVGVLIVALQSAPPTETPVMPAPIPVAPASLPGIGQEQATLKKCPDCAESVQGAAKVCRFCGYRFEPQLSGAPPSQA